MKLEGPLYLQRKGLLGPDKNKILDIGPQNIYFVREEQIREFVSNQGSAVEADALEAEIKRLVYFSTPRPEERTTLLSEITDLTNVEYDSVDVCPGLKTEILDLNFDTLPDRMRSHYDVVFNFGTTEHIFNQWNCFEFMHDALKVGGIVYHQLPASGYLDHGYYCYTPLFFREMAQANGYEIEHLSVTIAGESKIDALGIPGSTGDTLLHPAADLGRDNRIPQLNIHAILRKTKEGPFRTSLEIATAHSQVNDEMLQRYRDGDGSAASPALPRNIRQAAVELHAIKMSRSWRMTQPLRNLSTFLRDLGGR
jgi:hypothetical protein